MKELSQQQTMLVSGAGIIASGDMSDFINGIASGKIKIITTMPVVNVPVLNATASGGFELINRDPVIVENPF